MANAQADPIVAQKLRELFQREAETLHQLDHIQIPQFFAGFEAEERLFIAQEYIDGKTYWRLLQERQRQGCSFSQSEILAWLRDLLNVLNYLHSQNIVHRDISPDNIMLKRGAQLPVLIDFGVVKQIIPHLHLVNPNDPDDLIQASVSVGKFGYAPYEQIRMGQCSPRSDLYALAVTAVVLLTGKPPNLLIDAKSLEWQWQRQVRLDPLFVKILDQMMADKPQDRYPSAQAVLQALQPLEALIKAPRSQPASRPSRALRREPLTHWQVVPSTAVEPGILGALAAGQLTAAEPLSREVAPVEPPVEPLSIGTVLPHQPTPQPAIARSMLPGALKGSPVREGITQVDALVPIKPPTLTLVAPGSSQNLLALVSAHLHQSPSSLRQEPPQDRIGRVPRPRFGLRRMLVLSILASLPVGGAAIGIRSPHIAPLCWVLSNCAVDAAIEVRYQQAIQQADSAGLLLHHARDLSGLQQARQKLADSIAQLSTFSGNLKIYASAHLALPRYQTLLNTLDENLEKESRATQLFNRAEAEAQKATEQTKIAKTYQHYQAAQLEWRRVLATLAAVPEETFVSAGAAARAQEYRTRLDAVGLKLLGIRPSPVTEPVTQPVAKSSAAPAGALAVRSVAAVQPSLPSVAAPVPPQIIIIRPAAQPSQRPVQASQPRPRRAAASPARRASQTARPLPARYPPATSPLQVDRQWVAGSVLTSATQTLDNVAIWIDGTRTEADGKFVANLWIQNRSGRGFGFGPLYAESKDDSGQVHRSRVLLTSNAGTILEPGEGLSGQIYLLDRPQAGSGRLTLVVQESTSGERSFRIPF